MRPASDKSTRIFIFRSSCHCSCSSSIQHFNHSKIFSSNVTQKLLCFCRFFGLLHEFFVYLLSRYSNLCRNKSSFNLCLQRYCPLRNNTGISFLYNLNHLRFSFFVMSTVSKVIRFKYGFKTILTSSHRGQGSFVNSVSFGSSSG